MNRFWLGAALMALLILLGAGVNRAVQELEKPVLEALAQASRETDPSRAVSSFQNAMEHWKKNWPYVAALSDHTPMEQIDGLFSQANALARNGQWADFSVCCAHLYALVEAVSGSQELSWWQLL